jgi:hypothetical protein
MNRTTLPMKRVIGRLYLQSINSIFLPFQGNYNSQDVSRPDDCSWHPDQTVIVPLEEQKKKWWDLDDNRRKQVKVHISFILNPYQATHGSSRSEVGFCQVPPLLALATTPGTKTKRELKRKWVYYRIPILTFPCLPSSKKQALKWGLQRWQRDAYVRTEEFRNHGPCAPTTWVLVDGRDKIPNSAIEAGKDKHGDPIYIARAYYEDSIRTFRRLLGCF